MQTLAYEVERPRDATAERRSTETVQRSEVAQVLDRGRSQDALLLRPARGAMQNTPRRPRQTKRPPWIGSIDSSGQGLREPKLFRTGESLSRLSDTRASSVPEGLEAAVR